MKIEIGAGRFFHKTDGWLHQDIQALPGIDLVCDASKLPVPDGSVEALFSHHVVEHFFCLEIESVFREWHRVLTPNGTMEHFLPDFHRLWELYVSGYTFPERTGRWAEFSPEMWVCYVTSNGMFPETHLNHLPYFWYESFLPTIGFKTVVERHLRSTGLPELVIRCVKHAT